MRTDYECCVILDRRDHSDTGPDPTQRAWRGRDESGVFSACTEAREYSALYPDRSVTVWRFTLERGTQPVALYRDGKAHEDGNACCWGLCYWFSPDIMQVVAEFLSQQSLILDMERDPDNTAVAPCDAVELPSPSRP